MAMCIRNGWTGIRGDQRNSFPHSDRKGNAISKIYSRFNSHQVKGHHGKYFFVSSKEFKDLTYGLRMSGKIIVPDDVSQNFLDHMEAERREETTNHKTGEVTYYWKTIKRANHLLDCLYYCVSVAYIKGVFGIAYE
jgi:cytochrome c